MKVAIVHYWLVGMRGGERVLEQLLEMFPDADLFTHVRIPGNLSPRCATARRPRPSSPGCPSPGGTTRSISA